jgi:hypothetical protein
VVEDSEHVCTKISQVTLLGREFSTYYFSEVTIATFKSAWTASFINDGNSRFGNSHGVGVRATSTTLPQCCTSTTTKTHVEQKQEACTETGSRLASVGAIVAMNASCGICR